MRPPKTKPCISVKTFLRIPIVVRIKILLWLLPLILALPLAAAPAHAWLVERVSLTNAGAETEKYYGSGTPSISYDGRYVTFSSDSATLVTGDTNGKKDIFVRDRKLGTTTRINLDSGGTQVTDYGALYSRISGDGRFVAFDSETSQLAPGQTQEGKRNIYLYEMATGTLSLITKSYDGSAADDSSTVWGISADGRYIVFYSYATNLVSNDTNERVDIFVYDRQEKTISMVSRAHDGGLPNGSSYYPAISGDGRYVVFTSSATNLVAGLTVGGQQIYRYDRQTGTTVLVSTAPDGTYANKYCYDPHISGDGRYVVFHSPASNLTEGVASGNTKYHIYVRDVVEGTTTLVSKNAQGVLGDNNSSASFISPDGRSVIFYSSATNLLADNTNLSGSDVFFYDRVNNTLDMVNQPYAGGKPDCCSSPYGITENGKTVLFTNNGSNLIPNDQNSTGDVFVSIRTTDDWTIKPKGQIGGWRDDLAVSGNIAALIEGTSVSLYDISGETPVKRSTLSLGYEPGRLLISGTRLYLISAWDVPRFTVVDITNPAEPAIQGECASQTIADGSMAALGNYVYHTLTNGGKNDIQVIDVGNPAHPTVVKTLGIPGAAIAIAGGRLYTSGNDGAGNKFWVYDLSDPLSPAKVGELSGGITIGLAFHVDGTRVYSAAGYSGVQIFDVATPATPNLLTTYSPSGVDAKDIYASGNTLYIAAGQKVVVVDVTNPQAPVTIGQAIINGAVRVKGSGGAAYVMSMEDMAIRRIGISGGQPVVLASVGSPVMATGLLADGSRLYLGTADFLWIYNIADPSNPQVIAHDDRWKSMKPFAVTANRLYGSAENKLYIVDVTNSAAPAPIGSYASGGNIFSASLSGTAVFLALDTNADWKSDTSEIVDASNPAAPVKTAGALDFTGEIHDIAAGGNLACIAGTETQGAKLVKIYDVTTPASPVLKATITVAGDRQRLWMSGATLFVSSYTGAQTVIEAFDLTNPAAPARVGQTISPKQTNDIQIVTPAGKDPVVLTAVPGGSVLTYGYSPASGNFYPGPECHSPYSTQVTATPSAGGYTVVTSDESYGSYLQELQTGGKCTLQTKVDPPEAAQDGCYATPTEWGPDECGTEVFLIARAISPWNFKEWSGAASGTDPDTYAVAQGNPSIATAHFWKPTLALGTGNQNPPQYTEIYGIEGEFDYANGRKNMPVIHITLTANEVDDWLVTGLTFLTSGTGNEKDDVAEARLYLGQIGGNLLGTKTFGEDNAPLNFGMNVTVNKGSTVSMILVYDLKPERAFPCNSFSAQIDMSRVAALPINYPPGVKLPPQPAGVTGGPTQIKAGDLVIDPDAGNNQYGEAEDPAINKPLTNPLKVRLRWQHPATVNYLEYRINPPADTFGAFLAGTRGLTSKQATVALDGYAQETLTLGTQKGKNKPYYTQVTPSNKGAVCLTTVTGTVFTAWGLGLDLNTAAKYDNPNNAKKFGTFLSAIQVDNEFTLTIDMAPTDFANVEEVLFAIGSVQKTGTVVTQNKIYKTAFDMAAFDTPQKLIVTIKMDKGGQKIEQKAEYDVKFVKLPSWVTTVSTVLAKESFQQEWNAEETSYKFTFNYPTNFTWSDYVPSSVGLLGGLSNNLDIEFTANATYKIDETSVFGATVKGKPTILGKELDLEGGLSGEFDPNFAFERGNGTIRASISFDLPEKGFSKTFLVYGVPITVAVDLGGNVEIFIRGSAVLNNKLEFEEIGVAPGTTVTGNLTLSLSAVLGLAKLAATGSPTATVEIELVYKTSGGTSTSWKGEIVVPIKIIGSLFWGLASSELYATELGPWTFGSGRAPAAFRPMEAVEGPVAPRLLSTSSMAISASGSRMVIWIGDAEPQAPSPNPDVFYRHYNGSVWTDSAPLIGTSSPDQEWETDPAVIFMSQGKALAAWTANKGEHSLNNLDTILAGQDIAWALWDGSSWSAAGKIINDAEADGTVAMAYDGYNDKAMAVWVHNSDPQKRALERTAWELMYAVYDPTAGIWTQPSVLTGTDAGKAEFMPSLAADGNGNMLLLWAGDDDGAFYGELTGGVQNGTNVDYTNSDSNIYYSQWTGSAWSAPMSITAPNSATDYYPCAAFSPGNKAIAVWVEKEGTLERLRYRVLNLATGTWSDPGLITESPFFIEDPHVVVDGNAKATVVWRGSSGGSKSSGNLYSSSADMSALLWSEPSRITNDDMVQWQASSALDESGKIVTVWSDYDPDSGSGRSSAGFSDSINVAQADPQSAELTGGYSDEPVDGDSDSLYEELIVKVGVKVAKAGDYEVTGELFKGNLRIAAASLIRNGLATGDHVFALSFHGGMIRNRGLDGPYTLKNVTVMDVTDSWVQTAYAQAPYTTASYGADDFEGELLRMDKPQYRGLNDQMLVTLVDRLLNTDVSTKQAVAVKAASAMDPKGILIVLTETGNDTGVFTGVLGFTNSASSQSLQKISVIDRDLVYITYDDKARSFKWAAEASWLSVLPGDVNGDGTVGLADMITVLQIMAKNDVTEKAVDLSADISGDRILDLEEAIFILQILSDLRQ